MKFLQPVNVQVMSRRSFRAPSELLEIMRFFEEALPQFTPSVFNWTDPVNKPWNLGDFSSYIPSDRAGEADSIYWIRKRTPKAEGKFIVDGSTAIGPHRKRHGGISFVAELNELDVDAATQFIKAAALTFDGDLAQVHWVSPQEEQVREEECSFDVAGSNEGFEFSPLGLQHWLPALPWAVVFGAAYVRLFGLERLLSAPAFTVEQLSTTAVYIQLSRKLTDLKEDYEAVQAVRQEVQAHLGQEAFFDTARAYQLRGPKGDIPAEQFLKAIADFRCPPPGTNGFQVPHFEFI